MQLGSRGGEAHGPRLQAFAHNRRHARHVLLAGSFVVDAAFTHHIGPHGAVGYLGANIDGPRHTLEEIQVFGETLPLPVDPLGKRCSRDILHVLHDFDHALTLAGIGLAGSKAHTAVAHDQGRNAVDRGGTAVGVPGCLAVHVRVCIDPARRHQAAPGINDTICALLDVTHCRDDTVLDRDTARKCLAARTVDYLPVANDQIVHCLPL